MAIGIGSQNAVSQGNFSPAVNVKGDNNTVTVAFDMKALAAAMMDEAAARGMAVPVPAMSAAVAQIASGSAGDGRLASALHLLAQRKPEEAEALLKAVAEEKAARIEQDSRDAAEAFRALAAIASVTDLGRAQDAYEKALAYDPGDLESALNAGWIAVGRGQLDHAADLLRRVQENSSSARLLFWTHMGFADVFEWRGDTPHAVGACVEAVNLAKAVRDKFPESELWRRNLRVALSRYGDAVKRRGEDALGWYQRALALFESTSPDVQRPAAESTDYAFLLNKIGREWLDKGDTQGASGAHSVALRIYGGLSAGAPDRVDYRHGVMITRTDLGNICAKIGDWKQASGHYQAAMQIAVQQLQADPQSMEAKRDVGLLNVKVGHVLAAIGDTENALAAFRGGLSLVQPIAESDPGNREYQHDVARAQFYVGQAAARLGQMPDAGVALRESVRIFQALTTINPANVAWREGLREADKLLAAN